MSTTDIKGWCTLCRSRCGAIYQVSDGKLLGVRSDDGHPTGGALCPKGRAAPEIVGSPLRLTSPMRRTKPKSGSDPGWVTITWEEALTEVAAKLCEVRDSDGAEAVAFAVSTPSGTSLSDSADWIDRFVRNFGSPNICYATEICNWHKDCAHAFTFGVGIPTADYANTSLALLWGNNPAKTWLAQSSAIARGQRSGAKLAVVDPLKSTSALRSDHWLGVIPGTDAALALGIANVLISSGRFDSAFVRRWTNGPLLVGADNGELLRGADIGEGEVGFVVWDQSINGTTAYDTTFAAVRPESFALRGTFEVKTVSGTVRCRPAFDLYAEACAEWPLEDTCATTGVDKHTLAEFIETLAAAKSVAYHSWSGVGQSANATQTERAIATLYALTGSFDVPGGNVVLPKLRTNALSELSTLDATQRAKALGLGERPLGPPSQGWVTSRDLCTAILSSIPYRVRAIVGFGTNMLVSQPDPERTKRALEALEFYVHLDLFMNPTAELADIVLPVNSAWEHEAIRTGFEISTRAQEHVQFRPRMVAPVGESKSDTEIIFDLARRIGLGDIFFNGDIHAGWNYQLEPLGVTVDELKKEPGGIRIPLKVVYQKYGQLTETGGVQGFNTPTRRVELYSEQLRSIGQSPVPIYKPVVLTTEFPLVLTTAKNGYFCHSQHRAISSLRRRSPEPHITVSPSLAAEHQLYEGEMADVATVQSSVRMKVKIDASLNPKVVIAEYGWWQEAPDLGLPGADPVRDRINYNRMSSDDVHDPISGSVPMRGVPCRLRAVPGYGWGGERAFVVTCATFETPEVVALVVEPADGGQLPPYRPGQHVVIRDRVCGPARSYSLIGPGMREQSFYTLAIKRVDGGAFSSRVHDEFGVGTAILITEPSGVFTIPPRSKLPIVLIAAGIGVTPFISYLEVLANSPTISTPCAYLYYGCRDGKHHTFKHRVRNLQRLVEQLRVITFYSRPTECDVKGCDYDRHGRVDASMVEKGLIERRARFYLCGPSLMISHVKMGLIERGVPSFDIFSEAFESPRKVDVLPPEQAEITFSRSKLSVVWRPGDGTLLDIAEKVGADVASGCRLGQCEACAVTVLKGSIAHQVVVSGELGDGLCLACQAIPLSNVVVDA